MKAKLALKLSVCFGGGLIFWTFFAMVFIVYSFFTPGTKDQNQFIFLSVYPILYLLGINLLIHKLFSEKGVKALVINNVLIIGIAAASLYILLWMVDFIGLFF